MNVPETILDFIFEDRAKTTERVLDLGCGTGISTRQVAPRVAEVVGCDPSSAMLARAKDTGGKNISYVIGSAKHIPEKDASFDGVTIFSAFHWFAHRATLDEIFRVIRPNGWLAIINRENSAKFEKRLRSVIGKYVMKLPPSAKEEYDPERLLLNGSVSNLRTAKFTYEEASSRSEILAYVRSRSIWNYVPLEARSLAEISIQKWLDSESNKQGLFVRQVEIVCITCTRPNTT